MNKHIEKYCEALVVFLISVVTTPAIADSAVAWKAYQEGRNPVAEVGLLVLGSVVFFGLLVVMNKFSQRRKNKHRKKKR